MSVRLRTDLIVSMMLSAASIALSSTVKRSGHLGTSRTTRGQPSSQRSIGSISLRSKKRCASAWFFVHSGLAIILFDVSPTTSNVLRYSDDSPSWPYLRSTYPSGAGVVRDRSEATALLHFLRLDRAVAKRRARAVERGELVGT